MSRSTLGLSNALLFRAIGYAFPLLLIPLYSRWLGPKAYGQLGVVLTFCSLLQAVCEYGHTIGGGGRLARATSHHAAKLISASIYSQKFILLVVSLLVGSIYFSTMSANVLSLLIFFGAFFAIVLPDALTPVWIYHGMSAVPRFAKLQFVSRLITLVPGLMILRAFRSPVVGTLTTGLPFGVLMLLAMRGVRPLMAFPSTMVDFLSGSTRALATELPFFIGALAAVSVAPLAMQIAYFFDPGGDLGAVYLSVSLWTAVRQLCMLPHQTNYGRAAAQVGHPSAARMLERPAFVIATTIATITVFASFLTPSAFYVSVFGEKYADVAILLPRILISGIPFSVAYGIVLNKIAAKNMSFEFSACYIAAAVSFVAVFVPLRHEWPVPVSLPIAMIAGDVSFLICSLFFLNRRTARLCTL
jgi:O-antigen/teichoic acid export membrane protein